MMKNVVRSSYFGRIGSSSRAAFLRQELRARLHPFLPNFQQQAVRMVKSSAGTPKSTSSGSSHQQEVHRGLQEVLKNKSSNQSLGEPLGVMRQIKVDPDRKTRYQQAILNSLMAFGLLLFSAQTLKSANRRRQAEEQLEQVNSRLDRQTEQLQFILSPAHCQELAQKILETQPINRQQKGSFWSSSNEKDGDSSSELARLIRQDLMEILGDIVKDVDQDLATQVQLEKLLAEDSSFPSRLSHQPMQVLGAVSDKDNDESLQNGGNVQVIKKRVFTM